MPKPGEAEAELCAATQDMIYVTHRPIFLCAKRLIVPLRSGPKLKPRSPQAAGVVGGSISA